MPETSFTNRQPSIGEGLDTLANQFDILNQKLENIQATLNSIVLGQLPGIKITVNPYPDGIDLTVLVNPLASRILELLRERL